MLDGFVKVMVYFRNAIYSFLYSCALLEKLALSNGTTILSAAFLLVVIVLGTCPHMLCLGMVLTTLVNLELAKHVVLILLSLQSGFEDN